MVVLPVQSLEGLEMETFPLTVPAEQRLRLKEPVILPAMGPPAPPPPPIVVSPIRVTVFVMIQPFTVRMAPICGSCCVEAPATKNRLGRLPPAGVPEKKM